MVFYSSVLSKKIRTTKKPTATAEDLEMDRRELWSSSIERESDSKRLWIRSSLPLAAKLLLHRLLYTVYCFVVH